MPEYMNVVDNPSLCAETCGCLIFHFDTATLIFLTKSSMHGTVPNAFAFVKNQGLITAFAFLLAYCRVYFQNLAHIELQ